MSSEGLTSEQQPLIFFQVNSNYPKAESTRADLDDDSLPIDDSKAGRILKAKEHWTLQTESWRIASRE